MAQRAFKAALSYESLVWGCAGERCVKAMSQPGAGRTIPGNRWDAKMHCSWLLSLLCFPYSGVLGSNSYGHKLGALRQHWTTPFLKKSCCSSAAEVCVQLTLLVKLLLCAGQKGAVCACSSKAEIVLYRETRRGKEIFLSFGFFFFFPNSL